ncbi:hypothetical protein SEUCBS139899_005015 [Sporothrix eucalyptigena]|uniref:Uncharacterized protein n=1 Tax=Sporothrix eucalyptigena TaxID=1812306 RepID=A0ABP0AWP9_9PEZI
MGWFWSSKPSTGEAASSSSPAPSTPSQSDATTATSAPPSSSSPASSSTAEDLVNDGGPENDPELRKFMAMFQNGEIGLEDPRKAAAAADALSQPSKFASWKAAWSASSPGESSSTTTENGEPFVPRERSLAEATLPVSMSCRQAFDLAWACQSPAGQWRAVYRHGGVRPCSDLWDDFWFCMRVKGYAEGPLKEEAIRSHYRKKEIDRYYLPGQSSSEDIWRSRTVDEVLPPGAVFQQNFHVVVGDKKQPKEAHEDDGREDASQILADAERRQQIRRNLGYNK